MAVVGGAGIHARVGQPFWTALIAELQAKLRAGPVTDAVVESVDRIGRELATHFPVDPGGDVNELPDTIDVVG